MAPTVEQKVKVSSAAYWGGTSQRYSYQNPAQIDHRRKKGVKLAQEEAESAKVAKPYWQKTEGKSTFQSTGDAMPGRGDGGGGAYSNHSPGTDTLVLGKGQKIEGRQG